MSRKISERTVLLLGGLFLLIAAAIDITLLYIIVVHLLPQGPSIWLTWQFVASSLAIIASLLLVLYGLGGFTSRIKKQLRK